MKNKLGITEGLIFSPSKQRGGPNHCIAAQVFNEDTGLSVCSMNATKNEQEATNNAKVCADALEIANKNGLYPTQLLEQRDELLEIVKLYQALDMRYSEGKKILEAAGYDESNRLEQKATDFVSKKAEKLIQSIEKE